MLLFAFSLAAQAAPSISGLQDTRDLLQEEQDYYKKWLNQDVRYIITDEEREVFEQLSVDEEREQFIEQFWSRRDPDPRTSYNDFKEEHYRRMAYANEHFESGTPGWLTDRGRIYIIHGPPDEVESHASGGFYKREIFEGGGSTSTYPFEKWWYRNIQGLGDVELEFVDPTLSGEYRLALSPDEKDAMLHLDGVGQTLAEELGLAEKKDRPFFTPGNRENYYFMNMRARDNPFQRFETYTQVQRPVEIKYKDLKSLVDVEVRFDQLPALIRADYFSLDQDHLLVPITLQLDNRNLTFREESGFQVARMAIYGSVTSLSGRIILEFDDDLVSSYPAQLFQRGLQSKSLYQKQVPLPPGGPYKLELVIKDLHSEKIGIVRQGLASKSFPSDKLSLSSLILSDTIQELDRQAGSGEMFTLGNVRVRPNAGGQFSAGSSLGVYLQVYNAAADQNLHMPVLESTYQILSEDGEEIAAWKDQLGETVQYHSPERVVLLSRLPTEELSPGSYQVRVIVQDRITGSEVSGLENFRVEARP